MSTQLYAPRLVDLDQRPLHLVEPGASACTHCKQPKFAMRWFYVEDHQTWLNVVTAVPTSLVDAAGREFMVAPCVNVTLRSAGDPSKVVGTVIAATSASWALPLNASGEDC